MKLPPPSAERELPPEGNHLGTCIALIDLGTQDSSYLGKVKHQRKVYIEWVLPNEVDSEGRQHTVGKRYTLSSDERANLRKDLESWRGRRFCDDDFHGERAFDLSSILGANCLVSVVHHEREGKVYANVMGISSLPKGTPVPTADHPATYLSLDPESFDADAFSRLSEGIRKVIAASPEYKAVAGSVPDSVRYDDIPF